MNIKKKTLFRSNWHYINIVKVGLKKKLLLVSFYGLFQALWILRGGNWHGRTDTKYSIYLIYIYIQSKIRHSINSGDAKDLFMNAPLPYEITFIGFLVLQQQQQIYNVVGWYRSIIFVGFRQSWRKKSQFHSPTVSGQDLAGKTCILQQAKNLNCLKNEKRIKSFFSYFYHCFMKHI